MRGQRPCRRATDAGVTLVEVLVVLVIVAVMAGVAMLTADTRGRGTSAERLADALARRITIAAEAAVLTGRDAALSWAPDGYRFHEAVDGSWRPHAQPELARTYRLDGVELEADGSARSLRIGADLAPPDPAPFRIALRDGARRVWVVFDGLSARTERRAP